jgi:hypothetical protein
VAALLHRTFRRSFTLPKADATRRRVSVARLLIEAPAEGEQRAAEATAVVEPLRVGGAAVPAAPPADTAHG